MGTRCVIQIAGSENEFEPNKSYEASIRLYRHYDGNPGTCLPVIARAVEQIEQLVLEDQNRHGHASQERHVCIGPMAHAIVASSMSARHLPVKLEERFVNQPKLTQLGDQCDLEWVYVVDCNRQLVNLYSVKQGVNGKPGRCTGAPREHLAAGFFRDAEQVFGKEYRADAVDWVLAEFAKGVSAITATGWQYNELSDPYGQLVRRTRGRKAISAVNTESGQMVPDLHIASAFCI